MEKSSTYVYWQCVRAFRKDGTSWNKGTNFQRLVVKPPAATDRKHSAKAWFFSKISMTSLGFAFLFNIGPMFFFFFIDVYLPLFISSCFALARNARGIYQTAIIVEIRGK